MMGKDRHTNGQTQVTAITLRPKRPRVKNDWKFTWISGLICLGSDCSCTYMAGVRQSMGNKEFGMKLLQSVTQILQINIARGLNFNCWLWFRYWNHCRSYWNVNIWHVLDIHWQQTSDDDFFFFAINVYKCNLLHYAHKQTRTDAQADTHTVIDW